MRREWPCGPAGLVCAQARAGDHDANIGMMHGSRNRAGEMESRAALERRALSREPRLAARYHRSLCIARSLLRRPSRPGSPLGDFCRGCRPFGLSTLWRIPSFSSGVQAFSRQAGCRTAKTTCRWQPGRWQLCLPRAAAPRLRRTQVATARPLMPMARAGRLQQQALGPPPPTALPPPSPPRAPPTCTAARW